MESRTIYAVRRNQKPGMFRTYRETFALISMWTASAVVAVALIFGTVRLFLAHTQGFQTALFCTGMVGGSYLMFRASRRTDMGTRILCGFVFTCAVALAIVQVVR